MPFSSRPLFAPFRFTLSLVDVYGKIKSRTAQGHFRALIEPLTKSLGMENQYLQSILMTAEPPADHLLLKMLHVLTENRVWIVPPFFLLPPALLQVH